MIRHLEVYRDAGMYAGWPANHGAWQWGDEFLVGFMRGPFDRHKEPHHIGLPFEKLLARSHDGGETWGLETPDVDFHGVEVSEAPAFNLAGGDIIRCCGSYDHGGETAHPDGSFYLSRDRGHSWEGAYAFTGIAPPDGVIGTMRTCVLPTRRMVFLSYARQWFCDATFVVTHDGDKFHMGLPPVCDDGARAVMPAAAEIRGQIVVALRRRLIRRCWIDAYVSEDNGRTWHHRAEVGNTGDYNGNPPALIAVGDRLYCAYANRDECAIVLATSEDAGQTWSRQHLRAGACPDIGYPRLFLRDDGRLVCVYYWSADGEPQHIAASIITDGRI